MRSRPYLVRSAGAGSRLVGDLSGTELNRSLVVSSLLPSVASTRAAFNLSQLCMDVTGGVAERRAHPRNTSWGSAEWSSVGCANKSVLDGGYASYEVRDTLWIVVPFSVIYTTIFVVGVLGNVITCVVISRNKSMHTATNYYLFSLAISDLLLLLTGVPQELYFIWYRFPYPFGNGVCIMASFAAETSANATVLTITAFTVERYVAICKPFLSHTMSRLSRAVRFVLVIWLIAMGLAIPQALAMQIDDEFLTCTVRHDHARHVFFISTMLVFVSPMSVIIVLYILIGLQLRRSKFIHSRSIHRGSSVRLKRSFLRTHSQRTTVTTTLHEPCTLASSLQELTMPELTINRGQRGQRGPAFPMDLEDGRVHLAGSNRTQDNGIRHVVKMLVAVVIAFFLCWAPFHAQRLFAVYANEHSEDDTIRRAFDALTYVSGILYFLSTCINPVLYNIMSHKFREAFKETLAHYLYRRPSHQLSEDLFFRNASWRSHTNYSHCLTATYSPPPCACSTQFLLPGRSAALQRPLVVSFRRQKFASLQYHHARPGTSSRCARTLLPRTTGTRTDRSRTDTHLGLGSFDAFPLVPRSSGPMNLSAARPQRYEDDPSTRSDVRATSTESAIGRHSDRSDAPAGPVCAECGVHHPAHCRYSTPVTGALRKLSAPTSAPTTKLPRGSVRAWRASWADACGSSRARAKLPLHPVRRSQSLSVDVGRSARSVDDDTTARHEPTGSRSVLKERERSADSQVDS